MRWLFVRWKLLGDTIDMNIYGVTGYPTPDFTDERHCRTFSIPNSTIALAVFMGALWELTNDKNWQQIGDMTPAEAADMMQDVIWNAYDSDEGICPVLEAPYWDTYDNADDEEPEGSTEPWYGELVPAASMRSRATLLDDDELTWRENLGIWAIAGFIAYSGQIGAAIAFVPFARRFVLKFRGNPLGAIAEIFIDGEKLATMDTASAEDRIKAIDIQLPDDDEEHEVWVAVGEDSPEGSTLQVVRKELNPNEVYPDNLRYSSDCDCVQQTYDDGSTWVNQPGQDPRHSTTFLYPPVTADDPRCQAASNMSLYFENLIETVLNVLSTGLDALGLATAIMPIFTELGPVAILFELGLGLSSALVGLGVDVISSEFTPETFEALTCIFYCNIEPNGSVTADDLSAINSEVGVELNPDVYLIMAACFLLMGEVGLSNAGTLGEAPADCDACACGWIGCVDFRTGQHGWNILNDGTINARGMYVAGQGILTTGVGAVPLEVYVYQMFSAVNLSRITIHGHHFMSGTPNGVLDLLVGGVVVSHNIFYPDGIDGEVNDWTITWAGDETPDQINLYVDEPGGGGFVWLEFRGRDDTAPSWVDDCP